MIPRILRNIIQSRLGDKKAIVLLGPRQVGKTTLIKAVFKNIDDITWLSGDDAETRLIFENINLRQLKTIVNNKKYLVIDEAQRIKDIGIKMKLVTDQIPETQLIATGSSSFELANKINEPLTGRKWEYKLYPLAYAEMVDYHGEYQEYLELENRLVYGHYPEVITSQKDKLEILNLLASDYLYKDLLVWNRIKKSDKILKLLQAIAFQLGNQVSYSELGRVTGLDNETVESYIDLLEKAFVIFRLNSFSRNLRNELKKSRKIYFYDTGIRNAIIANFSQLTQRNDVGALWENYLISERIKYSTYNNLYANKYFWRTTRQQEIDYVEEREGKLFAYEFKWNTNTKAKISKSFTNAYPESETHIIHPLNYSEFLS